MVMVDFLLNLSTQKHNVELAPLVQLLPKLAQALLPSYQHVFLMFHHMLEEKRNILQSKQWKELIQKRKRRKWQIREDY
jgi:hypothetical protein